MDQVNKIYKLYFKYVSLNVLSMLGLSLYVLADTFFIANGVGSKGLIGLNLALPVYSLINGTGLMLGIGGSTRYSIARGRGDADHGSKIFVQTLIIGVILGSVYMIAGLFFTREIAALLGATSEILPYTNDYLKIVMPFSIPFIMNNIFVCFVRNDENPNLAMAAMLIGCLSNVIFDYIFVFPFGWGMTGAAIATGGAPLFSMLILSVHKIRGRNQFKLQKTKLVLQESRNILAAGIPAFVTELSSGIIILIFNFIILDISGNTGVGAYGIISNIALVCVALYTGIAQGVQPIISLSYGMGNQDNIKKLTKMAYLTAFVFGVVFYLIGVLFPYEIAAVFNKEGNKMLADIAASGIQIYFIGFLIMGINIAAGAILACIEKPKEAFLITILRGGGFLIPAVLILSNLIGINGVWLSVPVGEALSCMVLLFMNRKGIKKQK